MHCRKYNADSKDMFTIRFFNTYYPADVSYYKELLEGYQQELLENRHRIAEINLLYNILQGITDPTLLQKINLIKC